MHEYEIKRQKNHAEETRRKDYCYAHIPGYKDLDTSISTISVEFEIERLGGNGQSMDVLRQKLANISARKKALLREAGLPEDYLEPIYDCPDCRDTGYIGNQKCHCFTQRSIQLLYAQSNLQLLTKQNNFSLLSDRFYGGDNLVSFKKAENFSKSFVKNFDKDYQNIIFCGTVGTGKTFLSICIAKELLDTGHSVIYYSSTDLFRKLSDYSFSQGKRQELENLCKYLYNCELLIIDDLGTELTNSFVINQLFTILNERDLRHNSTIVSTNHNINELQNRYQDRVFSRIMSHFEMYKLQCDDIRLQLARK